jgi:two-component system, sensor histidine kinase RegB
VDIDPLTQGPAEVGSPAQRWPSASWGAVPVDRARASGRLSAASVVDPESSIPERNRVNFSWLMKLRWSSIAGQTATILGVYVLLEIKVPLLPLFTVVGIELLSNVLCAIWFQRRPTVQEWHLAIVLALDVALLTGLLFFTGGPFNPFSFLYLVNIALAAVALHAQWTWMLVALALLSFGLLPLVDYWELPLDHLGPDEHVTLHRQGMWVAFGVAAGFIVHFLWRVTGALAQRERELHQTRVEAAQKERLASLATVAAGAAHELATPLGTIALAAVELERDLDAHGGGAQAIEDARLIRDQVARCRRILDQMGGGLGKSDEQTLESVTLSALFDEVLTGVRDAPPVHLEIAPAAAGARVRLPPRAMAQALRSLVTNAQDASPPRQPVVVRAAIEDRALSVEVRDRGAGMARDVLQRVGEPFFTTKPPGQGMGLGLYLTRAVVERLGGELAIESHPPHGTRARVIVPAEIDLERANDATQSPIDLDRR